MPAHAQALENARIARQPLQNRSNGLSTSAIAGRCFDSPEALEEEQITDLKNARLLLPKRVRGLRLHTGE